MKEYLKRTEVVREKERDLTNQYIRTRRRISREKYTNKREQVVDELLIPNKDIIFGSEYAPLIVAQLSIDKILEISKNTNILEIGYYEGCTVVNPSVDIDEGITAK